LIEFAVFAITYSIIYIYSLTLINDNYFENNHLPFMKQTIIFISLLLQTTFSFSQNDLYIPLEFQQGYKNQTRSMDGKTGKNYWQNYAEYKIEAEVIPGSWQIIGNQTVEYTNNSPDSLSSIILKAYPNHYKKGSVRDSKVRLENLTNGMIISELIINGDSIDIMDSDIVNEGSTLFSILLKEKIPAGSTAALQVNWTSELPKKYKNRMGAYDSSAAFMAY